MQPNWHLPSRLILIKVPAQTPCSLLHSCCIQDKKEGVRPHLITPHVDQTPPTQPGSSRQQPSLSFFSRRPSWSPIVSWPHSKVLQSGGLTGVGPGSRPARARQTAAVAPPGTTAPLSPRFVGRVRRGRPRPGCRRHSVAAEGYACHLILFNYSLPFNNWLVELILDRDERARTRRNKMGVSLSTAQILFRLSSHLDSPTRCAPALILDRRVIRSLL